MSKINIKFNLGYQLIADLDNKIVSGKQSHNFFKNQDSDMLKGYTRNFFKGIKLEKLSLNKSQNVVSFQISQDELIKANKNLDKNISINSSRQNFENIYNNVLKSKSGVVYTMSNVDEEGEEYFVDEENREEPMGMFIISVVSYKLI